MPPVKQRLLSIAVSHNRSLSVSEEEFHQWATRDHCTRAARIHARHGIETSGMFFNPESARATAKNLNRQLGGRWMIDDHDMTVKSHLHSLDKITTSLADPKFKALQQEEEPYMSGENIVGGEVVNLDTEGALISSRFGMLRAFLASR
ncbi:hypothetical protein BJX76DRAFT_348839 [Aspergillus varians]